MIAVSVSGRLACHSASTSAGMSSRSGLNITKRAPRLCAAVIEGSATCRLTPPAETMALRTGMPPKATTSSVVVASSPHRSSVRATLSSPPMTCGMIACAAPAL